MSSYRPEDRETSGEAPQNHKELPITSNAATREPSHIQTSEITRCEEEAREVSQGDAPCWLIAMTQLDWRIEMAMIHKKEGGAL